MPIKPWKTISTNLIHETQWIEVKEDMCEVDGKEITYTYIKRKDEGPFMIAEENDKLWVVQQYRHPIKKIVWQFPGEGKANNESWEETAQRGLREELGKQAKELISLGETYPDPGSLEQKTRVFLARDLYDVENNYHNENEVEELEVKAFTLAEIETMIETGEICDGWTLSALYLYQRYKNKH